MLLINQREK